MGLKSLLPKTKKKKKELQQQEQEKKESSDIRDILKEISEYVAACKDKDDKAVQPEIQPMIPPAPVAPPAPAPVPAPVPAIVVPEAPRTVNTPATRFGHVGTREQIQACREGIAALQNTQATTLGLVVHQGRVSEAFSQWQQRTTDQLARLVEVTTLLSASMAISNSPWSERRDRGAPLRGELELHQYHLSPDGSRRP